MAKTDTEWDEEEYLEKLAEEYGDAWADDIWENQYLKEDVPNAEAIKNGTYEFKDSLK